MAKKRYVFRGHPAPHIFPPKLWLEEHKVKPGDILVMEEAVRKNKPVLIVGIERGKIR